MDLIYYFDQDEYTSKAYEYNIDFKEIENYFNSKDDTDLINDLEEIFLHLKEKDQKEYIKLSEEPPIEKYDKQIVNFEKLLQDDRYWCVEMFSNEEDITKLLFEDELKDYFEDEAYKQFKEENDYDDEDPYKGMF